MDKKELKAEIRKTEGRNVKNLRKEGIIPANVFGKKIKSQSIQLNKKEFELIYKEVGETGLITLKVGADELPVLVSNVQKHPISDEFIHVDFHQVDLKTKVTAEVPVELVGESPAEKQSIGTVVQYINEIEVEALPMDLPEKFDVDVSVLVDVDQAIFVKDLKVDATKIEIKTGAEEIVVKVEPPQKEEVVETPVETVEGETPNEEGDKTGQEETSSENGETQKDQ